MADLKNKCLLSAVYVSFSNELIRNVFKFFSDLLLFQQPYIRNLGVFAPVQMRLFGFVKSYVEFAVLGQRCRGRGCT
jgi:hypothetical protein